MHLIETRDLTYTYPGNVTALHSLNFVAPRNARIAVIGSNGAGKSTLFKCFNGIFKPTSGSVLIRGEPITRDTIREVRKFVGIVFQNADDQIFSPTVEQDVAFGPANLGLDDETIHHRVHEALKLVGIEDLAHRVPHHLSGGEKKRVAIAGIIAMEPEVLVLDEPTAGLDPKGVHDLIELINSLSAKFGMTVIFSTHDVSMVAEVADYVYVMNKGRFVAEGSVEEIFLQPDLLRSVRLDVPVLPKLIASLNEHGVPVPMAYTYDDAERALVETYKDIRPGKIIVMIEELFYIEKPAYRDSFIHNLDARVKIVGMIALIIAMVAIPYSPMVFTVGAFFLIFLGLLWASSSLPWQIYAKRLLMVLPFGIFIIFFQIFFTNRYYTVFHVVADLPFGIHIYAESIQFAAILLVKFIVCISAIILLSSTTKLHDMLEGAGRMGLPPEFALTFGMMIRYLFVFGYIYRKINESLATRCFDPFNSALSYRYRMKQIGYTVGTIFIRSYEQGERVYTSMLCRGYGKDSHIFITKKPLQLSEWTFLSGCLVFVIAVPVIIWMGAGTLF